MAVRCLVPVFHRPISPPSSPAARVRPSGLNATLSTALPWVKVAVRVPGAGVPQADMAAVVAGGEGLCRPG